MSDEQEHNDQNDEAFGERVARTLRSVEPFGDQFETDLVAAIRADRAIEPHFALRAAPAVRPLTPAWWRQPLTFRASPLASLAVAASLAAIISLGTIGTIGTIGSMGFSRARTIVPAQAVAQITHDTVNVVRFVFVGPAKTVALVGDFNAWGARPVSLTPTGSAGTWTASVPLPSGRHEYAFIVDGQKWVADPFAPSTSDEFNTSSSIITVGS